MFCTAAGADFTINLDSYTWTTHDWIIQIYDCAASSTPTHSIGKVTIAGDPSGITSLAVLIAGPNQSWSDSAATPLDRGCLDFAGLEISDPDVLAKTRVSVAIAGDLTQVHTAPAGLHANQFIRIQADGRDGGGGTWIGGNIEGDVVAEGAGTFFGGGNDAIGHVRAWNTISGKIEAVDKNIAAVRVLGSDGTLPAVGGIQNDILAEQGRITTIFSTGPIGTPTDQVKIWAANGIDEIRIVDEDNPSTALNRSMYVDVDAGTNATSTYLPANDGRLWHLETAGSLHGEVHATNLFQDQGDNTRRGILVQGDITAAISVDYVMAYCDIVGRSITGPVSIGKHLRGAIVAYGTPDPQNPSDPAGRIESVRVGLDYDVNNDPYTGNWDLPGFHGLLSPPANIDPSAYPGTTPPNNPWFVTQGNDGGSVDAVIRGARIVSIEVQELFSKAYRPRIEAPQIDSIRVHGSISYGAVWSGLLEYVNGQVQDTLSNDYATVGAMRLGCLGSQGDVWIRQCPLLRVDNNVLGEIHLPELLADETIRISEKLGVPLDECWVDHAASNPNEQSPRGFRTAAGEASNGHSNEGHVFVAEPSSLSGQVVINRDNQVPSGAWAGQVIVGADELPIPSGAVSLNPATSDPLDAAPYYQRRSVPLDPPTGDELGGGAVGLVPFHMHDEDCTPPNGQVGDQQGIPSGEFFVAGAVPVLVRHYGPIKLNTAEYPTWKDAFVIEAKMGETWDASVDYRRLFQFEGPGDAGWAEPRGFGLSKSPTDQPKGGIFRLRMNENAVLCADVDETNGVVTVVWDTLSNDGEPAYEFRVLGDCDLDGIPDFEDPDFHLCDQETCKANYSRDLELGVQDIFDFLNAYFAGLPCADFNESGTVTVQDIFDFLAAWFSHPAGQLCDPNHAPAC